MHMIGVCRMLNRNGLKDLAETRLREARTLLDAGCPAGAYYLGGYVIECGLKAVIAKQTNRFDFPDKRTVDKSYTHDLGALILTAGLEAELNKEKATNRTFEKNWQLVQGWTEASRYSIIDPVKAGDLVDAISDKKHGVLRWLKRHW